MGSRKPSVDKRASDDARLARQLARVKGISVLAAFAIVTKGTPRVRTALRPFDMMELTTSVEQLDAEHRDGRLLTLRLDLEAALLRLDACCSLTAVPAGAWPTLDQLRALEALIDTTADLLVKRPLLMGWERCQIIDRHFPKLRLCRRVTALVTRITGSTPQRPLGVLMSLSGEKNEALRKDFFSVVEATRKGKCDPATVKWLAFEPLLLRCQNAELQRTGKARWAVLRQMTVLPVGPTAVEAYVAFLELERADLLWCNRHWQHFLSLLFWLQPLGNVALLGKVQPFYAGVVDPVDSWIEHSKQLEAELKRDRAAARKVKSRKKLGEKV